MDIAFLGGADISRQCLAAGVVDELRLHLVAVLLGDGARPFDGAARPELTTVGVEPADGVVHLRYRLQL
jgi:dihydrofolate reductase